MPTRQATVERDQEILRLMDVEHLRPRTIAKRLGLSESTVSRAWRRAMDRLSKADDDDDDWDELR